MDKVLSPGEYVCANQWEAMRHKSATVIQQYARVWAARKEAQRRRQERDEHLQRERQQRERQQWEADVRKRRQEQRAACPITPADFAILLAEVEAWRCLEAKKLRGGELARIRRGTEKDLRVAHLSLLQQETHLLRRIGRLKQEANQQRRRYREHRLLCLMGEPLIWVQSDGETATVYTPETTRARELHVLYLRLSSGSLQGPDRLDALAAVRDAVGTYESPLAGEVRELLQREETLLARGRSKALPLSGLRRRLSTQFFRLLLDPAFNPQAQRATKLVIL
ncbi:flagellar associated protein [Cyclospora cayetanensis]|uniref:Flagellar associated protein n=1 Tax=Cyclospora cayetanensis TaxID=88456 RepID=A0A1D3CXE5_9EIME|nr:flagellar associated protein [Cyclospora cayetanensis]